MTQSAYLCMYANARMWLNEWIMLGFDVAVRIMLLSFWYLKKIKHAFHLHTQHYSLPNCKSNKTITHTVCNENAIQIQQKSRIKVKIKGL